MTSEGPLLDIVLFDVDDTLYSTTSFAERARWNAVRAMIAHGFRVDEAQAFQELGEVVAEFSSNYDQHFDRLLDRLGRDRLGAVNPAVVIAAGVVAYHRTKERELGTLPDARTLLEALQAANVRAGVVSAGLQVKQAEKLVRLRILPFLDPAAIFFSDQLGVSKPNPKIFTKSCQRIGVEPGRALYVGNHPLHDVAAARAAGLRTVLYTGAGGRHARLPAESAPHHEVQDLRQLLPVLRTTYRLPV